jgi:branched-chain amino acid transport system substrate-binding protein
MNHWKSILALIMLALLSACGDTSPIRIGFIGGLSDRNSDTGQSGLNGVILAAEEFNRNGGVNGRMVEIVSRDDAQNAEKAAQSARELVNSEVAAVIGPFTSSMAEVIVPIIGAADILQVSPTITSMDFYGKDDNLFRINRTTRDNARDYAGTLDARGLQNIAVAYDTRNRNFTESWLNEFRAAIAEHNAQITTAEAYHSAGDTDFETIIANMLISQPEGLLFISGALDVARLAQQARRQAPELPIAAAEWAANEQLIEFGGEVVEGLIIVQNYDRDDTSARYRAFSDAYFKRFQRQPGYSSVSAYDAALVVLGALKAQRGNESLKQTILRQGSFEGLQQQIEFDENGDTQRKTFFTEIRDGRYVKLPTH